MGLDAVKFILKNIAQPIVPLYDEKNQAFTLIVDGDIIEIPRDVFLSLFRVMDSGSINEQVNTITQVVPIFKGSPSMKELQNQIQSWFTAAQNKEQIEDLVNKIISDLSDDKKEE